MLLRNSIKNLQANFTQIPNDLINDDRLSPAAKGVYCYLASKPENWKFTVDEISSHFPKPIKNAIKELEENRWLIRQTEAIKGKGKGFEWAWYIAISPFSDEDVRTIAEKHEFNYNSKITTIVEIDPYNNTDYYSNTDSDSNTGINLDRNHPHPVSPSPSLSGDTPETPDKKSVISIALDRFQDGWNNQLCEYCPKIAKISVFNDARRAKVKARLTEVLKYMKAQHVEKDLLTYFLRDIVYDRYIHSQFLRGEVPGRNGTDSFKLDINHIVRPEFFAKMVEYRYDDRAEYRH